MATADRSAATDGKPVSPAMRGVGIHDQREATDHRRAVDTSAGPHANRALRLEEGCAIVPQERGWCDRRKVLLLKPDRRLDRQEPTDRRVGRRYSRSTQSQHGQPCRQNRLDQLLLLPQVASQMPGHLARTHLRCEAISGRPTRRPPHRQVFFLPLTVALSAAAAVNFGALDALIFSAAPIAGLRPVRAPRLITENFPKPEIATSRPSSASSSPWSPRRPRPSPRRHAPGRCPWRQHR